MQLIGFHFPDRQVKKVMEYFNKDPDSFTSEKMSKISKAGNGLLTWVKAMLQYHEVAKGVEPKRRLVAELQQKQDEAEANLTKIRVGHSSLKPHASVQTTTVLWL